jgi:hypothetical protein
MKKRFFYAFKKKYLSVKNDICAIFLRTRPVQAQEADLLVTSRSEG